MATTRKRTPPAGQPAPPPPTGSDEGLSQGGLAGIAAAQAEWESTDVRQGAERAPERRAQFETLSGLPVKRLYGPADVAGLDYLDELGFPGRYPYARGPYPTMYRSRPWTMRQIAGYGTGRDTNARLKYLIGQGQTGISIDFDMPTLMGYDSDDPRARGEVGREGVAVDTLDDLADILDGIDIGAISVSMTINPTAWILFAMYLALAERWGVPRHALAGTVQADILKEYIAQKEWIYPIPAAMRIVRDLIIYSVEHLPHYNPINISGYHIREAGATAVQEAAFTLANGIAYVEEVRRTGLAVDDFAPRLAFYFIAERDFFEEIAKFRAARRVWARIMRDRFGARKPESMRLRFHCQTAGSSLTAPEPLNNIARTALQALSAVLGGAQSLHTNGMDEALAIPSELAMKTALRTQQIILDESRAANTVDPMAGGYFTEALTGEIAAGIWAYLGRIEDLGGAVAAAQQNFFQTELADTAYRYHQQKERGELTVVGVNKYLDPAGGGDVPFALHAVDPDVEARQRERLARVKHLRDGGAVARCLGALAEAARGDRNLIPPTIDAVRAHATLGEIVQALRDVFGTYVEHPVF
ncbi:MAG TPA: methylmalonyl-CoA mutase family protein [bacterium]|nr:methylmalonyl-CoA mutase family protein [bacterium]